MVEKFSKVLNQTPKFSPAVLQSMAKCFGRVEKAVGGQPEPSLQWRFTEHLLYHRGVKPLHLVAHTVILSLSFFFNLRRGVLARLSNVFPVLFHLISPPRKWKDGHRQ